MTQTSSRPDPWARLIAPYKQAVWSRSLIEAAVTVGGLFAVWTAAFVAFAYGLWPVALLLVIPSAGFMLRLFMMQHDCGHGSFFPHKAANDWTGRVLGVLTFTPYEYWRRSHAMHHAAAGDLDRRGLGAVDTLTVEEYRALSPLERFGYRLYRHPVVMFGIGPAWVFFIQHRVPFGLWRDRGMWVSTVGTSLAMAATAALAIWLLGVAPVLLIVGLTVLLTATVGVWLFYVQHQYEGVEWVRSEDWKPGPAALATSSHYVLPGVLRWFTANIGMHHVHHLSSRIPYYRLPEVLRAHPELDAMNRIRLWESFRFASLTLWDEAQRRLVPFRAVTA